MEESLRNFQKGLHCMTNYFVVRDSKLISRYSHTLQIRKDIVLRDIKMGMNSLEQGNPMGVNLLVRGNP